LFVPHMSHEGRREIARIISYGENFHEAEKDIQVLILWIRKEAIPEDSLRELL